MCWDAARASGSTEKMALTVEGEPVQALPLWVAVHQECEGGLARCASELWDLGLREPSHRCPLGCPRAHACHLGVSQNKGAVGVRSSVMSSCCARVHAHALPKSLVGRDSLIWGCLQRAPHAAGLSVLQHRPACLEAVHTSPLTWPALAPLCSGCTRARLR